MIARKLMVAAAVSSLTVLFLPTAAGAAKPVQCGQLVTSSLKLTADLGPCPGDGLVIAKKGVSLDLNGHTIQGMGDPTLDQVGVRIASVDGAEVSNGTVRDFTVGVSVEASVGSSVRRITASNNVGTGASNHGDGILVDGSTKTRVIGNDVGGNGPYGGISLVDEATNNLIKGNNIHDNIAIRTEPVGQPPWGPPPVQQNIGVRLESGSNDNTIDGNRIAFNGAAGISVPGPDHTGMVVTNNVIEGNGQEGVVSPGDGFILEGNTISNNGFDQFHLDGQGPYTYDGLILFGNFTAGPGTVADNTIDGNAGNGIFVIYPGYMAGGRYDPPAVYDIRNNRVRNNGANGIFVACDFLADAFPNHVCLATTPAHTGQQITGNTTSGNGGAGAGTSYWDLYDENPPDTAPCDHNTWLDNTAETANPPCTLATSP